MYRYDDPAPTVDPDTERRRFRNFAEPSRCQRQAEPSIAARVGRALGMVFVILAAIILQAIEGDE